MKLRLTLAAALCALVALSASAQDRPTCKVESKYDRFTDVTEDLCTIQKVGDMSIIAVATYKGKRGTNEAQYSLIFSYLTETFESARPKYDKTETLFILADDYRRQLPLGDYKQVKSPVLRGNRLFFERLTAQLDRETLSRMMDAQKVELRVGDEEIELTADALARLRDLFTRTEQ